MPLFAYTRVCSNKPIKYNSIVLASPSKRTNERMDGCVHLALCQSPPAAPVNNAWIHIKIYSSDERHCKLILQFVVGQALSLCGLNGSSIPTFINNEWTGHWHWIHMTLGSVIVIVVHSIIHSHCPHTRTEIHNFGHFTAFPPPFGIQSIGGQICFGKRIRMDNKQANSQVERIQLVPLCLPHYPINQFIIVRDAEKAFPFVRTNGGGGNARFPGPI